MDIGEGDYFIAAKTQNNRGKLVFGMPGTAGSDNFGREVRKLSLNEVLEAARLGAIEQGYVLSDRQIQYLENASRKPTRILILSRS